MEHNEILNRIGDKIVRLGEAKLELESQLARVREECDSLLPLVPTDDGAHS